MRVVDYYFESAIAKITIHSLISWGIFTIIIAIIILPFYKKKLLRKSIYITLVFFVFYLSFMFSITVINRTSQGQYHYELELFWSYKAAFAGRMVLLWENFWNVVLFVPIGVMLGILVKKRGCTPVLGLFLSLIIELSQLVTRRGLFEFDDIFHNTAGSLIGLLLLILFNNCRQYFL